jgi:hypothetical protein
VFGYLGVTIKTDEVWTIGGTNARYLGRLAGASAGVTDVMRASAFATATLGLSRGVGPYIVGTIFVTLADGTRYERALRPGAFGDAPKIDAEIARFNAIART